ncbi:autoinducer 2 sensor kinase/phosphatase LuxQ [Abditibacteriota bacterium]|nr:autoinducer 2 sensor kinase/phosphatase LuxQ [Abditibacteriota bacterium]
MLLLAEVGAQLKKVQPQILQRWRVRVDADAQVSVSSRLSRVQFNDHIPVLLNTFAKRLKSGDSPQQNDEEREVSEAHGHHRWQQGYNLRGMTREWGHLNVTLVEWLDEIEAPASARLLWAEFVATNEAEAVTRYEELLQSEARAKLHDVEAAFAELQEWDKTRGDLLRQASHDLRGSLSVVASATDLLSQSKISKEERAELASLLLSGVKNLSGMMGDLLDMARLEAGIESRDVRATDAGILLLTLCSSWRLLAEEKGLEFESHGPQTLWVEADATKVRRIAQNLALNAIKYTENGKVRVTWGETDDKQWFIQIADTGEGLEKSNVTPLAQDLESAAPDAPSANFQGQASRKEAGGEGIGLAIVRRLCELLDAAIDLHSTAKGSTFRVTFPREYESDTKS